MRHAYLILAHKNPEQLNILFKLLESEKNDIYVHVDLRSRHIIPLLQAQNNVHIISSHPVIWGGFSMIRATLELLRLAVSSAEYGYLHLLSGQCLPLWPEAYISQHFTRLYQQSQLQYMQLSPFPVKGLFMGGLERILVYYPEEFLGRFRGKKAQRIHDYKLMVMGNQALHRKIDHLPKLWHGSQWFSITREFAHYVLNYVNKQREFCDFFVNSLIPDEMFFQTILANSDFAYQTEIWRYFDPKTGGYYSLTLDDFSALSGSGQLFARKFDLAVRPELVQAVVELVKQREAIYYPR